MVVPFEFIYACIVMEEYVCQSSTTDLPLSMFTLFDDDGDGMMMVVLNNQTTANAFS